MANIGQEAAKYYSNSGTQGIFERLDALETSSAQQETDLSLMTDLTININNFSDLKVPVAQGYDWSPAFDAATAKAKSSGTKLRIPTGTYYISRPIDISGIAIEGDETSFFNDTSIGTRISCLTKGFSALKQVTNSSANITFSVRNIIILDADVGLDINYCVNCYFGGVYFKNCNLSIRYGYTTIIGGMSNIFEKIYMQGCTKGMDLTGKDWANNNTFINCYFDGTQYGVTLDCVSGVGAVNNVFIGCEFRSSTGFGIQIGNARSTTLDTCYYEANGASIVFNAFQEATYIKGGTFDNLRNNNALGHTAFIVATASAGGYFYIDSPYVYLPQIISNSIDITANLNFVDVSAVANMSNQVRFTHMPRLEGTPTNFNWMKGVSNYNIRRGTGLTLENKTVPHLIMKNDDETYGFDLYRNRANGGTGFGVKAKLNNIDIFNFDENGYMTLNKAVALTPIAQSSSIPNNSLFVDSSTNTLRFKDNSGVYKTVTLT